MADWGSRKGRESAGQTGLWRQGGMTPLDGGGCVHLGHPLRPNAIRHGGPQPPHDVNRRRRGTQRRGGPLMRLERPTSAGLMYADTAGDGQVVVLMHGVLMNGALWTPSSPACRIATAASSRHCRWARTARRCPTTPTSLSRRSPPSLRSSSPNWTCTRSRRSATTRAARNS